MDQHLPNELAARVKFTQVVKRMEKIAAINILEQKKEILRKFFESIFDLQTKFHDEEGQQAGASFYPFLRLFIPHKDSERGSFGIKEATLGRLFVKALAINPKSDTAVKLTNLHGNSADYGDIVFDVMKSRSPEVGTLTVYEVNSYLDMIADHFQHNERSRIDTEIVCMFSKMSAIDRKWLTRILLKKLRLGVGDKGILELYNPRAFELYNQCGNLSDVCQAIQSNILMDDENGLIQIFKQVRPMLCERGYISNINHMLAQHDYYLETKMDGERCQVHVNGKEFKYFSRGGKDEDLTKIFGLNDCNGLYSPFFYGQINRAVRNAIFDGEMMVWDKVEGILLKKSENFTAKFLKSNDSKLIPCFCIYDIIYYNGVSLVNKPYAERTRLLGTLIKEQKGALMLCQRTKLRDGQHFLELLNKAFDANEEGVVIKQGDSKYHPGQREKGGWFKMKPDYENNLISDFDLLIIGGYYNDKQTGVDSFLLGVLKKGVTDSDPDVFQAVCKIRNGLKRAQFREICNRLEPYKHKISGTRNNRESPNGIELANANPDFWFEPKQSIVLQIKASELVETTTYRTSHSFRFPRVMEIRWDKAWFDTCSLNEFQTFCWSRSKVNKLTKRHATADDLMHKPLPKRQKKGSTSIVKPSTSNAKEVEAVDEICKDLDFYIVNSGKDSPSVEEMETMVKRHGGRPVKFLTNKTFAVIAGNPKVFRIQQFIKKKECNIATPRWLVRAFGSEKPLSEIIKFTPSDMVFATDTLQSQFNAELDIANDVDEYDTPDMIFEDITDANHVSNDAELNDKFSPKITINDHQANNS